MTDTNKKVFEPFLEKVADMPFWIKEIIYIKIREEFEQAYISESDLHAPLDEAYQAYRPALTYRGQMELESHEKEEDPPIYRFLQQCADGSSLAEITLHNFWTLESTAKIHLFCLQKEYVDKPTSAKISATALYIAGRIKIGEYFRRIGKISTDELNTTVRKQKEFEAKGQNLHFAEVLIQLGYVTEQETKAILYLKDECKKRFIFSPEVLNNIGKSDTNQPVAVANELKELRKQLYDANVKLDNIRKIVEK
ncbi:MAG: hypothetical protein Q4E87_00165 [bacterium]|nr:hypothetical protein [bacterium]